MRALGPAIEDVNLSDTEEVAFASPDQRRNRPSPSTGTLGSRKQGPAIEDVDLLVSDKE